MENLDCLPDETLYLIVHSLDKPGPGNLFRVLSKVNRRLRCFALPYLIERLRARNTTELDQVVSFLSIQNRIAWSFRVAPGKAWPPQTNQPHRIPTEALANLLPSLRALILSNVHVDGHFMRGLHAFGNLRSLALAFPSTKIVLWLPPLQHLRLHLTPGGRSTDISRNFCFLDLLKETCHSLETMALSKDPLADSIHPRFMELCFPRLRKLTVHINYDVMAVFSFVQRHRTLLECNFYSSIPIKFCAALRLAGGEWPHPTLDDDLPGQEVEDDHDPASGLEAGSIFRLDSFAFYRHITFDDETEDSSWGWDITELALRLPSWEYLDDQHRVVHVNGLEANQDFQLRVIQGFAETMFPNLEYLTLHDWHWLGRSFGFMIQNFISTAPHFSHLKRLTFSSMSDENSSWDDVTSKTGICEYLEFCELPVAPDGQAYTLKSFGEIVGDSSSLERSEDTLMDTWERCYCVSVAGKMRDFAERCPALQEIYWYIDDYDIDYDQARAKLPGSKPLWKWRVLRESDGSVRLVTGELLWLGCLRGDPPPMSITVGEESRIAQEGLSFA